MNEAVGPADGFFDSRRCHEQFARCRRADRTIGGTGPSVAVDAPAMPARLRGPCGSTGRVAATLESSLGQFDRQDRRMVAVVITTDGRRVHVPIDPNPVSDVSLLVLLRSLLGLDGLLGLITGSRRENGGTRRNGR